MWSFTKKSNWCHSPSRTKHDVFHIVQVAVIKAKHTEALFRWQQLFWCSKKPPMIFPFPKFECVMAFYFYRHRASYLLLFLFEAIELRRNRSLGEEKIYKSVNIKRTDVFRLVCAQRVLGNRKFESIVLFLGPNGFWLKDVQYVMELMVMDKVLFL